MSEPLFLAIEFVLMQPRDIDWKVEQLQRLGEVGRA